MKSFFLCLLNCLLVCTLLTSCEKENKVIKVVSGNVIQLSSGVEVLLINVANTRSNYDYLCTYVLESHVAVYDENYKVIEYRDGITVKGYIYNDENECINDKLEKETLITSPPPIRPVTPQDVTVPEKTPEVSLADKEWSKPNIKSSKDVSAIYDYVIAVFAKHQIDYMPHIPVIIATKEEMYDLSGNHTVVGLAHTRRFPDGETSFLIHIIEGLTKLDFASVLAHEIMHTWINQNNIRIPDKADLEGLCNYASYITLKSVDNEYAGRLMESMMRNPDPIYGEGFRVVKSDIDKIGFQKYMENLMKPYE